MARDPSSTRPLVCLVDTRVDGHHPMYAAVYAQAFRHIDCDVWLAAPGRLIAAMPPSDTPADLEMKPWEPPGPPAAGPSRPEDLAARRWEALRDMLDGARRTGGRYPDLVVLLWFDDFIAEILPRRAVETSIRCPFAGLWFQPPPRRPRTWREGAKRLLRTGRRYAVLRSPLCAGILVFNPGDAGHLSHAGRPPILEVPEVSAAVPPTDEPALVADIRRRAAGRAMFTLVGSLEGRKGLRPFLDAAQRAPTDEWFFLMAGKLLRDTVDPETAVVLERMTAGPNPRVHLVDRWLDDATLDGIVACSDLLHTYYYDWPYSSNMIHKAATHDVPAIGGHAGYIGRMIRDYHLGFTVKAPADLPARFVPGFAAEVAAFGRSAAFLDGCSRYRAASNPTVLAGVLAHLLERSPPGGHPAAVACSRG